MIAWFTRNHVAANLLMALLLFLGLYSLNNKIPLEVFPDFGYDTISVSVSLRGATPEEVEQTVSIRIEEAVQDLEGIKKISSRSSEGSGSVTIEVDNGYDPRELLNDVKTRVDAINTFPTDAEKPVISLAIRTREVISVAVSGEFSEKEIRQQGERVRDELLRVPGVTQVELNDVRDYEISINVSQDILRQYGLSLADVAEAISNSSLDLSAGNVKTKGGEVQLRLKGQAYTRPEFERIVVKTNSDGSIIRVGDIAQVSDAFTEDPLITRFNGRPAAMVEVYRVGTQSAIAVADAVKDYVAERQASLPRGLEITTWRDNSEEVRERLHTLTSNAIQGGVLVLVLLTLFLRPSVAFWVFIGVPVSFMGAFMVMPLFGVTLNLLSLFGFILVLGIVVDDAIVTGENVYRHLQHSDNSLQATINGTKEVAAPVTFGVLTTVSAFIPMLMIEGPRGSLFMNMAVVIIPILLCSLVESKLVLPAHLKHIKVRKQSKTNRLTRAQQAFADGFEKLIIRYYQPILRTAISQRYATLAVFVGIFILLVVLLSSGWMRFIFFPRVPSDNVQVVLTMPVGTPFSVTDQYVQRITDAALELKEEYRDKATGESLIADVHSSSGSGDRGAQGTYYGKVRFQLNANDDIARPSNDELVRQWRRLIGNIPGAETIEFRAEMGHPGSPVEIELSGNDPDSLREVGDLLKEQLALHTGVFDIADSMSDGKQELQLRLRPEAYALGMSESEVIEQVREAFYGYEAQRIQRGRDDVRVMVRFPETERQAVANLQDYRITTDDDRTIPVAQVVELVPGESPSAIYRNNLQRTLTVTADIDKNTVNMTVVNTSLQAFLDSTLVKYPGISYNFEGEAKEQADSFHSLTYGIIFVLFAIYSLLAIPFKSYSQPLIVMSVIPFGTIGAFMGHWLMGTSLTLFSILGMLALVGVVVNDSLVLVDFINKERKERGRPLLEAIQNAGVLRFRPVMLTSLTTFFGLVPLLFETSQQAQFLIPMAISLGFGILFATFVTLLLVPVNYLIAWEIKNWFREAPKSMGSQPPQTTAITES